MRLRWVLLGSVAVAGVLVAAVLNDRTPLRSEYCVAEVGDVRAQVDTEQARWSALMAAIADRRGLPPRATTIAIATAFQESKIHNISYGDRDSLGLFQQRPSQGWGTAEQVQDPFHSIGRFYDGLVEVEDYAAKEITVAAQAVQRSAYPGAYAQHESYARALASSLRGHSPAAFSCQVNPGAPGSTQDVRDEVAGAYGDLEVAEADGTLAWPVPGSGDAATARGWGLAHWLVANAERLRITAVTYDGRRWTAEDSPRGWLRSPSSDAARVTARTD